MYEYSGWNNKRPPLGIGRGDGQGLSEGVRGGLADQVQLPMAYL
jgi:hypothetical protein